MIRKKFFGVEVSIQVFWKSYMVGGEFIQLGTWWWLNFWLGPVFISLEPNR